MERLNYEYSSMSYKETGPGSVVDAIYHKSIIQSYNGNPFIEAIPLPLTDKIEIARRYTVGLSNYTTAETKLDSDNRRFLVQQIRKIRFFLPFQNDLESTFYNTLVEAYSSRKLSVSFVDGVKTLCLTGDVGDAANSGFAILGYSGCGKSSSIKMLTQRFPQVIYHDINGNRVPQVLYLTVSCTNNNNFSVLYESIAKELDKLFETDIYYKKMIKRKTLGRKIDLLTELLQGFNVGLIFLDEIQLISFNSNKESSFESLMVITNITKTPFVVIGTEDSYSKVFKSIRNVRRVGKVFDASNYCAKKEYCVYLIKSLFRYQWFDEIVEPNQELLDTFYSLTKGIISFIIELYITITDEYLKLTNRPKIDSKFVKKVFKQRYGKAGDLLNDLDNPENQNKIEELLGSNQTRIDLELDSIKQQKIMENYLNNIVEVDTSEIIHTVVSSISLLNKQWSTKHIEDVCKSVIGNKKKSELKAEIVAEKTLSILKREGADKKKTKQIRKVDMINAALKEIKDTD